MVLLKWSMKCLLLAVILLAVLPDYSSGCKAAVNKVKEFYKSYTLKKKPKEETDEAEKKKKQEAEEKEYKKKLDEAKAKMRQRNKQLLETIATERTKQESLLEQRKKKGEKKIAGIVATTTGTQIIL
ncbi:hypothetical protein BOX15_Mlig025199g3 [Macrostomum lignano]|uniref:DUF148 domain-containing protein n=2 Tax=Macrostomum lignano TaxID=282301 RepID=A0A1I8G127_9PLAT|nr:hypothetical protein BOX15_Mlig025199g2 [Macrostomum lignano]PAA68731.1 hypothetical protein BOX15_Mlig025199g1 [Macrostomum lignano]PAA82527.1 hypothetical protein BOX15_Mlig025199g3 [Macrostomum lignano]